MSTTRGTDSMPPPPRLRVRRMLVMIPVLAVVAVAPWFIPWGGIDTADPSPMTSRALELQPSPDPSAPATPAGPTDDSVKQLAREVSAAPGYDLPVSPSEVSAVSTVPGPYQELGRIQIPRMGLDVAYGEGVFEKTLVKGPGHWPGTPMPGREGNSVISGHRNTHTQPFKELDELNPGDDIVMTQGDAKSVTYEVNFTKIIPEAEYKDFVLRQPEKDGIRQITLFACHPEGNPIFRIVVQATASPVRS